MTVRLPVVLLWHMHQPQYRDALTGEYVQPWTRCTRSRTTRTWPRISRRTPPRAVVNFTPVLLEQIADIADNGPASRGRRTAARSGARGARGVAPAEPERVRALHSLRAQRADDRAVARVSRARRYRTVARGPRARCHRAMRSVRSAVWYHLAWTGETIRRSDERVAALMKRRRHTPADGRSSP